MSARCAIALALLCAAPSLARADFYNQRNSIPGERAQMLGGAFTAIADDASAAYYNPAGLAFQTAVALSGSGTNLVYQSAARDTSIAGAAPLRLDFNRFAALPTSLGISIHFADRMTIAISMFQLDSVHLDDTEAIGSVTMPLRAGLPARNWRDYSQTLRVDTETDLVGVSFAYRLGRTLSLGVTMFYLLYQASLSTDDVWHTSDGNRAVLQVSQDIISGGLQPVIGLLWKPLPALSLGLTYSTETIHLDDTNHYHVDFESPLDGTSHELGDTKADVRLPHRLAAGIAWEHHKLTLTLDGIFYFPLDYPAPRELMSATDPSHVHQEVAHADASLGAEIYVNPEWVLRGGLYTNTSSAPDPSNHINVFGGTLGFARVGHGMSMGWWFGFSYGQSEEEVAPDSGVSVRWVRWQLQTGMGGTLRLFGS